MNRYERSWPLALTTIAAGVVVGLLVVGSPASMTGGSAPQVRPSDGLRGTLAPPPRPRPPRRYTPPMELSNSGTYKAIRDLQDPRAVIRASGASRLSMSVHPERALPALFRALEHDDDPQVRLAAARSIGRLGAEEGLSPLVRAAAEDPSEEVRAMAVQAHAEVMAQLPGPPGA